MVDEKRAVQRGCISGIVLAEDAISMNARAERFRIDDAAPFRFAVVDREGRAGLDVQFLELSPPLKERWIVVMQIDLLRLLGWHPVECHRVRKTVVEEKLERVNARAIPNSVRAIVDQNFETDRTVNGQLLRNRETVGGSWESSEGLR